MSAERKSGPCCVLPGWNLNKDWDLEVGVVRASQVCRPDGWFASTGSDSRSRSVVRRTNHSLSGIRQPENIRAGPRLASPTDRNSKASLEFAPAANDCSTGRTALTYRLDATGSSFAPHEE